MFSFTSTLCSTLIHSAMCTSTALPLFSFQSCLLLLAVSTFVESLPPLCSLSFELSINSVLFCIPSGAALTHNQLCAIIIRINSILPNLPPACLVLGRLSLSLPFFCFSSPVVFAAKKLAILAVALFHKMLQFVFFFQFISFLFF